MYCTGSPIAFMGSQVFRVTHQLKAVVDNRRESFKAPPIKGRTARVTLESYLFAISESFVVRTYPRSLYGSLLLDKLYYLCCSVVIKQSLKSELRTFKYIRINFKNVLYIMI